MDNENKNTYEGLDTDTFGTPSESSTEEVKSTPFSGEQEVPAADPVMEEVPAEEPVAVEEPTPVVDPVPVAQPVYTQANTAQAQPEKSNNDQEVLIMVLGIASIVLVCCCTYLSVPLGIVAAVLAMNAKKKTGEMSTMMTVGMICGIIGAVLSIGWILLSLVGTLGGSMFEFLENFEY